MPYTLEKGRPADWADRQPKEKRCYELLDALHIEHALLSLDGEWEHYELCEKGKCDDGKTVRTDNLIDKAHNIAKWDSYNVEH